MNNLRLSLRSLPSLSVLALSALALTGCGVMNSSIVNEPLTARPASLAASQPPSDGAIYHAASYRPIFEDRRARQVGDTLVVVITENTSATNSTESKAERTGALSASSPTIKGLPGQSFQGAELEANSSNKFNGKGGNAASNVFSGTIAVTVVEVLANGNLVVAGEKQVAISRGTEKIRLSGVVNPVTIGAGNTVSSTQIADARIEYKGDGYTHEVETMGWLARFFLTILPY